MANTQESGILGAARVISKEGTSLLGVRRELERDLATGSWMTASIDFEGAELNTGGSTRTANCARWARFTSRAVLGGELGRLRRGGDVFERTFFNELPIRGLEDDFSTR